MSLIQKTTTKQTEEGCPSCGARAWNDAGSCVYCGTRMPVGSQGMDVGVLVKTSDGCDDDCDEQNSMESAIIQEIEFLKKQFEETRHPSITQKIKNAESKLRKIRG